MRVTSILLLALSLAFGCSSEGEGVMVINPSADGYDAGLRFPDGVHADDRGGDDDDDHHGGPAGEADDDDDDFVPSPTEDAGPSTPPDPPAPRHFGQIAVSQYVQWGGSVAHNIAGQLMYRSLELPGDACEAPRTVSGCEVLRCNTTGFVSPFTAVNGGALVAEGNKAIVVGAPDATNTYRGTGFGLLWDVGTDVTITGGGAGVVPAFEATLQGPGQIRVTSPLVPAVGSLLVSRSWPLLVTWAGDDVGEVRTQLLAQQPLLPGNYVAITCAAPASSDSISVPVEVLSELPIGWTTSMSVTLLTATTIRVDDWQIWMGLGGTAATPDGRGVATNITLL